MDDDCLKFCTHSKFIIKTLGTHKFYKYMTEKEIKEFLLYCPEAVKIIPNYNKDIK
jgi:hypothetical protein